MSGYLATVNVPGYLPMNDDPPVFETAREAWTYLADERERSEDYEWEEGDGGDTETLETLRSLAFGYSKGGDEEGTVYGPTPGYDGSHDLGLAYCVTYTEEETDDE